MDELQENAKKGQSFLAEPLLSQSANIPLVCLNFKVPLRVRQQFKIYAARHNLSMTELLLQMLDDKLTKPDVKK